MPPYDSETGLKECSHCHLYKGYMDFSRNARATDGLASRCRVCVVKTSRLSTARWEHNHPEKMKEIWANSARRYYKQHKEQIKKRALKYSREHPEVMRGVQQRRRAAQMGNLNDGTVTTKSLEELLSTWTGICPFCGRKTLPTIDHIIALSNGGAESMSNLQLMCHSCNSSKGARKNWS